MTTIAPPWLRAPALQAIFDVFERAGHCVYAVGGCVRNTLLDRPVTDIDLSTDAPPETTLALAKAARIKAVPTGIDHGTVTLILDGTPYEVTTFRRDVATDGRRAVVAFAKTMAEDARRRDFTMNALYADRHGEVHDPVDGLPDLRQRHLRFIGVPEDRIREDYLRILRYFRFVAQYADPDRGMDAEALAAIAAHADGLDHLSRERVTAEMLKLLAAPDPAMALGAMIETGLIARLLGGGQLAGLQRLIVHEAELGLGSDALTRLVALGAPETDALRLSKAQDKRLAMLRDGVGSNAGPGALGYAHGSADARAILALRAALLEQPLTAGDLAAIDTGAAAHFPVTAADLMPALSGAALGEALRRMEARWIASDFALTREALLADD